MSDDAELLRRYHDEGSEEAFAEVVRRHMGLVYPTALRRCGGDTHRAKDVTQTVFSALARKAGTLAKHPTLAGWLYTSTRYAAAQAVRSEARRQEREAHAMREGSAGPEDPLDWERVRPCIDELLHGLRPIDRESILLRFFEGRGFAEIGDRLGTSEDAARMRVERALDKMRTVLGRRGVASTATALGMALATQAGAAVPAEVTAGVAATAIAAAKAQGVSLGVLFLNMSKLKVITASLVVVAATQTAVVLWQHRQNIEQKQEIAALRAAKALAQKPATSSAAAAAPGGTVLSSPAFPRSVASSGAGTSGVPLAPGLIPVETLGNAGRGTARSALATQLWAARTGNVELEASLLLLSPDEKARLQGVIAKLPAEVAAQYDSPEKLMAFALAGSPHPVGGVQILSETDQGPDDSVLEIQWQHADDTIVHKNSAQLHRDNDGWEWEVPPIIVDRAASYLAHEY